jgi:hypothetical protein
MGARTITYVKRDKIVKNNKSRNKTTIYSYNIPQHKPVNEELFVFPKSSVENIYIPVEFTPPENSSDGIVWITYNSDIMGSLYAKEAD